MNRAKTMYNKQTTFYATKPKPNICANHETYYSYGQNNV